jgi:hypothetical protein
MDLASYAQKEKSDGYIGFSSRIKRYFKWDSKNLTLKQTKSSTSKGYKTIAHISEISTVQQTSCQISHETFHIVKI